MVSINVIVLSVLFFLFFTLSSTISAQDTCSCSCCNTNYCSATYQGTASVSSCSSSCDSACGSSFTECAGPASGGSGSIITSCSSESPTTTVPWTGTWNV